MSAPTADRKATGVFSPGRAEIPQRTLRTDRWWQSPIWSDLGFAAFVIYATVRAFLQNNYYVAEYHYLTPFYSPCVVQVERGDAVGLHSRGQSFRPVPSRRVVAAVCGG